MNTAGAPAAVKLKCYRREMKGDGLDIAQIEAELVDERGNLCVQADTGLTFTVQGPASVIGVDNGNPEGMESLKGHRIPAFHGRAFVIIQSDGSGNGKTCTLCAHADGLPEEEVTVSIL